MTSPTIEREGSTTTPPPAPRPRNEESPPAEPLHVDISPPELLNFTWQTSYSALLESLATTGLASESATWAQLSSLLLFRLRSMVEAYLQLGTNVLFDAREEPRASGGWVWGAKEVLEAYDRIRAALEEFGDAALTVGEEEKGGIAKAPFTLQRLAELLSDPLQPGPERERRRPHPHYSTLPKYLRAVQRVLTVTSSVAAFPEDTYALPPGNESDHATVPPTNGSGGNAPASPATRTRRASSTTPITPMLSPIPWLVLDSEDDCQPLTTIRRSPSPAPLSLEPATGAPGAPPSNASPEVAVATHLSPPRSSRRALSPPGRVDELDPGLGTGEAMAAGPVAIGSLPLSPRVTPAAARNGDAEVAELEEGLTEKEGTDVDEDIAMGLVNGKGDEDDDRMDES